MVLLTECQSCRVFSVKYCLFRSPGKSDTSISTLPRKDYKALIFLFYLFLPENKAVALIFSYLFEKAQEKNNSTQNTVRKILVLEVENIHQFMF